MPNEVGLVGLIKFLARPLLRRQAYGDFFTGIKDVVAYTVAVATRGDLERVRTPARTVWSPHLGFDHRQVVHHIRRTFVDTGLWEVEGAATFGSRRQPVPSRASCQRFVPGDCGRESPVLKGNEGGRSLASAAPYLRWPRGAETNAAIAATSHIGPTVALTPGPGLARLGPGARSVALIAAAHAAR